MTAQHPASSDPDAIREEIESTRTDLSDNVNALADSVRPSTVAHRQVDRVKEGLAGVKDKVMGGDDEPGEPGAVGAMGHAIADAPTSAVRRARGNPLAAGVIVFGAAWLVSSLLPASDAETQAAAALKEKAAPLAQTAKDAAKDVVEQLQEPAQQAVSDLKESATDSATTVKQEAQQGGEDLTSSATDAASRVRDEGSQ